MDNRDKSNGRLEASETELVFWRSIQVSNDPNEMALYLEQFPDGAYAKLAKLKIAKLLGKDSSQPTESRGNSEIVAGQEVAGTEEAVTTSQKSGVADSMEAHDLLERAAKLEAELAKREAEFQKMAVEHQATQEADARAQALDLAKEREKLEAEQSRRESELKELQREREEALKKRAVEIAQMAADVREKKGGSPLIPVVIGLLIMTIVVGILLYVSRAPDTEELSAMLDAEKRSNEQLVNARQAEQNAARELELAKQRQEEARKSGDVAKQKELTEQIRLREIELQTQVALVRQREAEVQKKLQTVNAAKATVGDAKPAKADLVKADKAALDEAARKKVEVERIATEKIVAAKAAEQKIAAEKLEAEKTALARAMPTPSDTAPASLVGKPGWPKVGDWWTYRLADLRDSEIRRQDIIEVRAVTNAGVVEVSSRGIVEPSEWTHRPGVYVVGAAPGTIVFAPHLGVFQQLKQGDRWDNISFSRVRFCSAGITCRFGAVIKGTEQVTVEAGVFQAIRVELELQWENENFEKGTRLYTLWYSDKVKRMVKLRARDGGGNATFEHDTDVELIAYELH